MQIYRDATKLPGTGSNMWVVRHEGYRVVAEQRWMV